MPLSDRLALAAVVLLLCGCAEDPPALQPESTMPAEPAPPLPDPIVADETMPPSVDPVSTGGPACSPPTSTCFRYPFALQGNATAKASLTWDLEANDLDLYLFEGDEVLDMSNGGPTTSESLTTPLEPGEYEFVVQGSTTVAQPFHFEASFEPARPGPPDDPPSP